MSNLVSLWFIVGIFGLVVMTYQDYFNNMNIDDRRNFFLMGLTLSLATLGNYHLWYLVIVMAIGAVLSWLISKIKAFGEADVSSFIWIVYGFLLIEPVYLILFFGYLILLTVFKLYMVRKVYKMREPVPYYIVLLSAFIATGLSVGLF